MLKSLVLALPFAALAAADTTVAVLEFGERTVVRSTNASSRAHPSQVMAFWSSLHNDNGNNRRLTPQGMSVVGDLFNKPDAGYVMGVTSSQLASMPELSKAIQGSQGKIDIAGSHSKGLLSAATGVRGLSAVELSMDAVDADIQFSRMLSELKAKASSEGKTLVLHVVVDDENSERRLQEDDDEEDNADDGDADTDDAAAQDDGYYKKQQSSASTGFYGYGYTNSNGEYVVVSKTIFQIQYFQTVLWTALGLVGLLTWTIMMTANMPLMADTLLFGESAKMMGE